MIKKTIRTALIIGALFAGNLLFAQSQSPAVDESVEPSEAYSLEIDGKETPIFSDRLTELKLEKLNPQVKLKVAQFKVFTYGGMYVEYPRNFTFEADLSDNDVKFWNLSGNNTILMIQKYNAEMNHVIMANMLQQRYGEQNSKVSESEYLLMGTKQKGTRVVTTIGDSSIAQEIYSFENGQGAILLILQDSVDAQGKRSEEGTSFRELVSKTFKIVAKG